MSICSIESEIHRNVLLFSVTGEKHGNNVRGAAVWNRSGIKLKYSLNSSEISLVLKHRTIAGTILFKENTWPTNAFSEEGRSVLYEEAVSC